MKKDLREEDWCRKRHYFENGMRKLGDRVCEMRVG